jgi:alkyl sulfatase BDS1-like metallo-beta-lactamase superfamily hydrolase
MTKSIENKLTRSRRAISNGIGNAEIAGYIAGVGYTAEVMQQANTLLTGCEALHANKKKEYGEQFAATDTFSRLWEEAHKEYMKHVKIARIEFEDNRLAYESLMLSGRRKNDIAGWLVQATTYYTNALQNDTFKTALAVRGITEEVMLAMQGKLNEVKAADEAQQKEIGEAQQATKDRDLKLNELDDWMSKFEPLARIALEEKPQLLEILGFLERS